MRSSNLLLDFFSPFDSEQNSLIDPYCEALICQFSLKSLENMLVWGKVPPVNQSDAKEGLSFAVR